LEKAPWVESRLSSFANFAAVPAPALEKLLSGKRGDPLPTEVKNGERIYRAIRALASRSASEPACLVHGDAHAGNVFETPDGPGFVDWQVVQRESWALDVAYHIGAALTVEELERSEERLLRHYLDRLKDHGAQAPAWDEAWLRYRIYLIYGYFLWGITRRVVEPVILEFVKRLGLAVVRHRSFELLGV
jgi:thiamine kinase-like enzyme